jgi:phosphatidylinositol alpha-1,6-mannosyltransferase
VLDLCHHLAESFDITLLAPHAPNALVEESIDGVAIKRYRYWLARWQCIAYEGGITARIRQRPWRAMLLPLFLLAQLLATTRLIRRLQPDVIHAHWIIPQGLVAVVARRLTGSRAGILCTSHGGDLFSLRAAPLQLLKRKIMGAVDRMTVVSGAMAEEVKRIAPGVDACVIPMGTDLTHAFVPPQADARRDANQIVWVGRLVPNKGVSELLRAFKRVAELRPALRLIIVGDGPLRQDLEREASSLGIDEAVDFRGALPHDQLPDVYRRAAIAAFPYILAANGVQEGFGLVVVEAMGCGCPVIASDIPALRDTVIPGRTGTLVPPGDVGALSDAMVSLLDSPEEARRLSVAARNRAESMFDWTPIKSAYAMQLNALVKKNLGPAARQTDLD